MDKDIRSFIGWLINFLNGLAVFSGMIFFTWLWLSVKSDFPNKKAIGYALVVSFVLFLANALRLLYLRRTGVEGEDYIVSKNGAGGGIRVAIEAIKTELKAAAEQLPEVTRCRISILRSGPKKIKIHASYTACEGSNILELSEKLRKVLLERFLVMVPVGEGVKTEVDIDFESFSGKAIKKQEQEETAQEPPPPFTGPKYPVDGEL